MDPTRPEQDGFGPHALRHTFPPSFRAGTDLVIVADLLGHETLDTVRLYTAPDDEARANALDALITDQ